MRQLKSQIRVQSLDFSGARASVVRIWRLAQVLSSVIQVNVTDAVTCLPRGFETASASIFVKDLLV